MNKKRSKQSGFTLMELMVVVAIVGILSAIAYPNYSAYVMKGKRLGAKVAIMEVAQAQERYFSLNMKYAYDMATLNLSNADDYTVTVAGLQSDNITACADTTSCITYTVTAIAKSGSPQNNDLKCRKFTLTHTGVQVALTSTDDTSITSDDSTSDCW